MILWDYIRYMFKEIRIEKKQIKTNKKDDSKEGDIFVNCRSCNNYIYKNRSKRDGRYCDDCMEN